MAEDLLLKECRELEEGFRYIEDSTEALIAEQLTICGIPAPGGREHERAAYVDRRFRELGLEEVRVDPAGNVVGLRAGAGGGPTLAVAAHLDTVFGPEVEVRPNREGSILRGPGIGDNAAGIVAMLAVIGALRRGGVALGGDILFIGTVGEEGRGDLRGCRYLFTESLLRDRIDLFIAIDEPDPEVIITGGVGSKRYQIAFEGPGGHSWADFGMVNPIHALGRAVAELSSYRVPQNPRTSFNVGRIEGGVSVNTIAASAAAEVDLRSESEGELAELERRLADSLEGACARENAVATKKGAPLQVRRELIGDRPCGQTPAEARLVRTAVQCFETFNMRPRLGWGSTDSNIPMSMGIPAITLPYGGRAVVHRVDDWHDVTGREVSVKALLQIVISLVGIAGGGAARQQRRRA